MNRTVALACLISLAMTRMNLKRGALPQTNKAIYLWGVLLLLTFSNLPAWGVVLNSDIEARDCSALDNRLVVFATYAPRKSYHLGRKQRSGKIGNPVFFKGTPVEKDLPFSAKVRPRYWPEILYASIKVHANSPRIFGGGGMPIALGIEPHMKNVYSKEPDIRSFGGIEGFLRDRYQASGQASLPEGQTCVDSDGQKCKHCDNVISLGSGAVLFAFGVLLCAKVCWKVCFDLSPNSNTAVYVALVVISWTLIWTGMALTGTFFGLM